MNLKKSIGRENIYEEAEVNLTGVMNIFLILIPFLLLTAVFVKIAVLELSLPSAGRASSVSTEQKPMVLNILEINQQGFSLKSPGMTHQKLLKTGLAFNYDGLKRQLEQVKQKYPESEDIVISPSSDILYNVIIKVMDRCRDAGFPNISLAG